MSKDILHKQAKEKIKEIENADILIGIPSFNNAHTISHVVRAVSAGLAKYFPKYRSVLVNSDGGSRDGTPDLVLQTKLDNLDTILIEHQVFPVHKIVTPYSGIPGKGSAFRTIFQIADALNVKACAVVDSDLRSITPEWIELLIEPILYHGFDFVAPLYERHKYDGTITNTIVYPLTRALYGKRIRQPIGGDFGFSGKLASFYLQQDVWDSDVARYGIDIWMTTTSIAKGFKTCQSFLGAKIHDAKDPQTDLPSMLFQVIGSVFSLMEENYPVWSKISGSEPIKEFGFEFEVGLEPIKVNLERMLENFKHGVSNLFQIWSQFLPPYILENLKQISLSNILEFNFPDETWVETVYYFSLAYHNRAMSREHILKSLTPLYLGRLASFVNETFESSASEVEQKIEVICQKFEEKKTLLLRDWKS